MKFGLREKIFTLLLASIPLAAWLFVFRPSNARNAERIGEIQLQQTRLQALNRGTAAVADLRKELNSLTEALDFFHSRLPTEKEIDKILREVWQLAESNRLVTKSIRTLERGQETSFTSGSAFYADQPIAMEFEGDFLGLYTFLLALEIQPRIMRIREMNVMKTDKGPSGQVHASFVMSVFFECTETEGIGPSKSST